MAGYIVHRGQADGQLTTDVRELALRATPYLGDLAILEELGRRYAVRRSLISFAHVRASGCSAPMAVLNLTSCSRNLYPLPAASGDSFLRPWPLNRDAWMQPSWPRHLAN